MTVGQLAERVGAVVDGDPSLEIRGLGSLAEAREGDLSFLANPRYESQLAETGASAVLVHEGCEIETRATLMRVADPAQAFGRLAPLLAPVPEPPAPGVHPTAIVGADSELGEGVSIGPYAVVGRRCRIGAGSVLEAHTVLGDDCVLGDECRIYPLVSIRERVRMGSRVIIHSGTMVGGDGYGYTLQADAQGVVKAEKIPQLGNVEIGDDVEIGSNVSIDRARFGSTRLGDGVKVDNLVQIAHNVQIGDNSGVISQVGISGSTRVGRNVILWGQAGIAGHLEIGDGAQVLAKAGVSKDVPAGVFVVGQPAVERREAVKTFALPRTVDRLKQRIAALESELAEIKRAMAR